MVKVIDFLLCIFYHNEKTQNPPRLFFLDLLYEWEGRDSLCSTDFPQEAFSLQVSSGGGWEADVIPPLPGLLPHPAPSLCTQPYFSSFSCDSEKPGHSFWPPAQLHSRPPNHIAGHCPLDHPPLDPLPALTHFPQKTFHPWPCLTFPGSESALPTC